MFTLLRRMCSRVLLVLTAAMIVALITSANGAAGSSLKLAPAFQRLGNLFAMIPIDTATLTQTSCGPPTYPCARRDLRVAKLPEPVPNVGGVRGEGTIITDPDFGTEIIRVTDVDTDPHLKICAAQHSYCFTSFVTAGGGSAFM